jgi:hypothetical protein
MLIDFETFWRTGPWLRVKKQKARAKFQKTVHSVADLEKIQTARDRYARHLQVNPWKNPMMGSTWMGSWQDWVDFTEPPASLDTRHHIHSARCFEMGCPFDPIRLIESEYVQ